MRRCLYLAVGLYGSLLALCAQAQILDELEYRRDGADAVLAIRFVTPVQFQRSVLARSGDQVTIFYRVLPTRQRLDPVSSERRLAGIGSNGDRLPTATVNDDATPGSDSERRLLVRLSAAAKLQARAGRSSHSLEVVLADRGLLLTAPVPEAELPAAATGGYRVTLQSSGQAGAYLSAVVPASLQHLDVYTTRRVDGGRTLHETHIGPFATRAEAEAALAALRGRFPAAAVTVAGAARAAPVASEAVSSAPPAAPPAVAASAPAAAPAAPAAPAALTAEGDLDRRAAPLLARAQEALARGDAEAAIADLSALLDLPPTASSREAQALIGQARLRAGDTGRARAEFEAFLRLYPTGPDADGVRAALAAMSPAEAPRGAGRRPAPTTTLSGSLGVTYYGGQSKVRTQEFQDSPLSGLPELVSEATLSSDDQKQIVTSADVNWRHRDAEVDQRFVFRDSYTRDQLRPSRTRNKLSALYFDHRSFGLGTQVRLGRQSPLGGGVLGRFDGVQASYSFKPRWKAGVVAGVPTDDLLDTRRRFWGASIEAEALTPQFGASLYTVQQTIDGEVDRRAIGSEMRYFEGGVSGNAQIDYDVLFKGLNIASLQGTWQRPDNTVFNLLYDRRKQPLLALGNTLFFTDPNLLVRPTRVSELLQTSTLEQLRERARATTAVSTQAAFGVTTPLSPRWQGGADLRYTSTGAVAPVPDILPTGLPASGDIWSLSLQLIGTNLYSARDTHVVIVNFVNGPTFQGKLLSYNNSSMVFGTWQLEPSLKLYRQSDSTGTSSSRWSPGLRLTWRVVPQAVLESEVNVENSKTTGPMRNESASRTFFYVGGRADF